MTRPGEMSTPDQLYIDLLKKTLSFSLWPEPPVPVGEFSRKNNNMARGLARKLNEFLSGRGLMLAQVPRYTDDQRAAGEAWSGYADTMVGRYRLDNIEHCVRHVIQDDIPGDFIETGVWRGGSCIFMRGLLKALGVNNRKVFVADSFEGLPMPDDAKYPSDKGDVHHQYDFLAVSEDQVRHNFERYGLMDDQVVFLKGFFADSLPKAPIDTLSIIRLDGDMYSSTMDALTALYHKLSPGGFCIVDDYKLPACAEAVEDFRREHGLNDPLETIDDTAKFWRKSG